MLVVMLPYPKLHAGVKRKSDNLEEQEDVVIYPADIKPYDILLGRSKQSYGHAGNHAFRILIFLYVHHYASLFTKREKMAVVSLILDTITGDDGRFLREVREAPTDQWTQVTERVAREKISHALRDQGTQKIFQKTPGGRELQRCRGPPSQQVNISDRLEQFYWYGRIPSSHSDIVPQLNSRGKWRSLVREITEQMEQKPAAKALNLALNLQAASRLDRSIDTTHTFSGVTGSTMGIIQYPNTQGWANQEGTPVSEVAALPTPTSMDGMGTNPFTGVAANSWITPNVALNNTLSLSTADWQSYSHFGLGTNMSLSTSQHFDNKLVSAAQLRPSFVPSRPNGIDESELWEKTFFPVSSDKANEKEHPSVLAQGSNVPNDEAKCADQSNIAHAAHGNPPDEEKDVIIVTDKDSKDSITKILPQTKSEAPAAPGTILSVTNESDPGDTDPVLDAMLQELFRR